jgi:hypothetical protein
VPGDELIGDLIEIVADNLEATLNWWIFREADRTGAHGF